MKVVSVRENPEFTEAAIRYFQTRWASGEAGRAVYDDCIRHSFSESPLPQWYLLLDSEEIIGCAGLIPNDFISRMDLWPWVCALFIDESRRGRNLGSLLLERAKADARSAGFTSLYLCTDHVGYYEKFGYTRIGTGYHPWGESSQIFETKL